MRDKYLRKKIESIKRHRVLNNKVVSLDEYRGLQKNVASKTLLVVDDDETIRSGLKRILEAEQHKVLVATDGMELSRVIETSLLDLVILDINLPWVDGFELCQLVKSHHNFANVPLILMSSRDSQEDIARGFQAGANDYVVKPFEVDRIVEMVNKYLLDKTP